MNKEEYYELLGDKKWSKKRKKILNRDSHKCVKCGSRLYLQVHHLYYIANNKPWEYPSAALVTLCDECHEKWHDQYKAEIRKKEIDGKIPLINKKKIKKPFNGSFLRRKKKKDKGFKIPRNKLKSARQLY